MIKGRIVSIEKKINTTIHCLTGIPKKDQKFYKNFSGANGTIVIDSQYHGTTIDVKIFVYDLNKIVTYDIRDFILMKNNAKRISKKLLNYVVSVNEGKKVEVEILKGLETIMFDVNQLDVVPFSSSIK